MNGKAHSSVRLHNILLVAWYIGGCQGHRWVLGT